MNRVYYSQYKQDLILDKIFFKDHKLGFFLDIGANDGVTYSNTYFLEKNRNWNGICIEPLPKTFQKLKAYRNCILENCAVGAKSKKDIFFEITGYSEMLSGLKRNYKEKHLNRIKNEIEKYGGSKEEIEINTININTLLSKHNIQFIDYCNIDTEGSEFEILRTINFKKIKIDVITVEANYKIEGLKIKTLLWLNNYAHLATLGGDMLFVHKRMLKQHKSYKKLKQEITTLI